MEALKVGDRGKHEYALTPEAHIEITELLPNGTMKVILLNPVAWIDDDLDYTINQIGFIKY